LYFNSYNILGDPELNCWTGIPKQLTVSYQDSMEFGQNQLSIQVDDNLGSAIEGAYVCVTNDIDVFVGGFTSQDGSIILDCMPNAAGDLYVTVTSRGYIPHEGEVVCYNTDVAVGYSSHIIDDDNTGESSGNGNATANPSETIELRTDLYNYGQSLTATGVTAILISEGHRGDCHFNQRITFYHYCERQRQFRRYRPGRRLVRRPPLPDQHFGRCL
jgi:hypothetical protein